MVRSHHIKACAQSGKWRQRNRSFSYGREQATADKKQRRIYPNGPVFGDGSAKIRSGHGQRAPVRFFFPGIAVRDLPGLDASTNHASA
jgi:hypothetical protein